MKKYHDIEALCFKDDYFELTVAGQVRKFRIKDVSSLLEKASEQEKNSYEISPSGYGIHWPLIDEDLSIDGLLGIVHTKEAIRQTA